MPRLEGVYWMTNKLVTRTLSFDVAHNSYFSTSVADESEKILVIKEFEWEILKLQSVLFAKYLYLTTVIEIITCIILNYLLILFHMKITVNLSL